MKAWKSVLLWVLATILTVLLLLYQRLTGPTNPLRGHESFAGRTIHYRFLRSFTAQQNLPVAIHVTGEPLSALLFFRRYQTSDSWSTLPMLPAADELRAEIPGQPIAGKIEFNVKVSAGGSAYFLNHGRSLVARFRGVVPRPLLFIHILFMFLGSLLALRTGMEALTKEGQTGVLVPLTLAVVFSGGMILGPLVQKLAFQVYWTGFPVGFDLTDNKTLLAVIFWIAALLLHRKSRWWVVAATLLMLVVYCIPHSAMGTELNYETGKLGTARSLHPIP